MHICMIWDQLYLCCFTMICLVILFGISSGQKSSKESCWLNKQKSDMVSRLRWTKTSRLLPLKRGFSTNCFCSNIFRPSSQQSCSLVVFRHILQLHHVHGGLERGHHHHDSQLSPSIGGHPWDAKLGELPTNNEHGRGQFWYTNVYLRR